MKILIEVQTRNNGAFTESRLRSCLASLASLYRRLAVEFDVPQRISLEATAGLAADFLRESSGGERPQIITAALIRTIGEKFGVFDEVVRQGINGGEELNDRVTQPAHKLA